MRCRIQTQTEAEAATEPHGGKRYPEQREMGPEMKDRVRTKPKMVQSFPLADRRALDERAEPDMNRLRGVGQEAPTAGTR